MFFSRAHSVSLRFRWKFMNERFARLFHLKSTERGATLTSVFVSAGWIFVVERDSRSKGGGAKKINVFNKRFQRMGAIRMAKKGGKIEQVLALHKLEISWIN